jgi:hypothetical protein
LPACSCTSPYTGGGCSDYGQPQNPWLDSTDNGIKEWSYSGYFNETAGKQKIDLNASEIQSWLSTCTPDSSGNCLLPIKIHSDYKGKMQVFSINITYDFNISSIYRLDTNENKYYWNQTNVIAGEKYKKHYKARVENSTVPFSASGYYLLNQTASDCWVNETHFTPTGSPLYCPITFSVQRYGKIYHNISDVPLAIAASKEEKARIQDMSRNTHLDTLNITYPQLGYNTLNDGNAFSIIPINVTNLQDTGEALNVNVALSACPPGFNCERYSWMIYNLAENSWNETNATLSKNVFTYKISLNQVSFEARKRIRFNLTDIWNNTDSISYINVNRSYLLPPDAQVEKVYINKTDYTSSPLVTISGRWVNITWNSSIGPLETLDPEIIYTIGEVQVTEGPYMPKKCSEWGVSGINRCVQDCPDCYSEINDKVRWEKTVTLNNTGSTNVTNIIVKAEILKSTNSENDIKLFDPSGNVHPIDVINISGGYINWTISQINSGETQVWTIKLNSTPPAVIEENVTIGTEWTKWFNVTGASDIEYQKIWSYTSLLENLVHLHIYDNTTTWQEVTYDSSWGPPVTIDRDKNGKYDFYQWIIPSILAGQTKKIVVRGTLGIVSCQITNKTILNAPLTAGENAEWRWTINCTNLVDVGLTYSENIRLPLESSNIKLDGIPKEAGFLTVPPYGPYITIEGSLPAYSSELHTLEFKTPPVTIEVSPPTFPERFYVGEKASLILDIKVKNWASENISQARKNIDIRYGENLTVFEAGNKIDFVPEIRGYYALNIYNISAYETRSYIITYKALTADSEIKNYFRRIINSTQYLVYPIKVHSLADFPLNPLYQRFRFKDKFSCEDIDFIWLSEEKEYLSPSKPKGLLSFECIGNDTIVKLEPLPPNLDEYFNIFTREVSPTPVAPIQQVIYDFFEWLISIIKGFIAWITSLIT